MQECWSGLPCRPPGDLPHPAMEPRSPTLHSDSLPAEPQGKPKNTGMCSLSLLQRIILTQKLNWGILHCRQILYQLSHKGSPRILEWVAYPFSSGSSQNRDLTQKLSLSLFCLPYLKRTPFLSLKVPLISFVFFLVRNVFIKSIAIHFPTLITVWVISFH